MRRIIACLAVWSVAGSAWAAGTPAQKCEVGKKKAAASYATCRLKADAKLVTANDPTAHAEAQASCLTKLTAKLAKLETAATEAGSVCPTVADVGALSAYGAACTDTIAASTMAGGAFPSCGDNVVNVPGEQCDGSDLDGSTCASLGFDAGALACGGCAFDTSGCSLNCGNGIVDAGEDCDLGDLNGGDCLGEGFAGGALACGAGCVYDSGECWLTRFVDNADGSISDVATGLVWEKKIKLNAVQDYANLQDADNYYPWAGVCTIGGALCQPDAASEAACLAGVEGNSEGCFQCVSGSCSVSGPGVTAWQWLTDLNDAAFAGSNQWRLPSRVELEGLVDAEDETAPAVDVAFAGASCGAGCTSLASAACSCTQAATYWSSVTPATTSSNAWVVSFHGGNVMGQGKVGQHYVRAVRDGL